MSETMNCIKKPESDSELKRLENKIEHLEKRTYLIRNFTNKIRDSLKGSEPCKEDSCKERSMEQNRLLALSIILGEINTTFDEIEKTLTEIHEVVE